MKSKTIKKILRNKVDHWIENIENERVREAADRSVIVTGGAIASMLLNEEVNDFDIYFSNREDALKIAKYYMNKFGGFEIGFPEGFEWQSEHGHEIEKDGRVYLNVAGGFYKYEFKEDDERKYLPICVTNNAISLEGDIQLIFRFVGSAEQIHENYDFVHCTNYWQSKDNKLTLRKEALECLLSKELRYIGSKYPICSLIRTRKYINRGFTCGAGEYLKMCWQVNELDLTDVNVLREQLIGVDIHYFNLLIKALLEKEKKEEGFVLTHEYLFEMIDRIFN